MMSFSSSSTNTELKARSAKERLAQSVFLLPRESCEGFALERLEEMLGIRHGALSLSLIEYSSRPLAPEHLGGGHGAGWPYRIHLNLGLARLIESGAIDSQRLKEVARGSDIKGIMAFLTDETLLAIRKTEDSGAIFSVPSELGVFLKRKENAPACNNTPADNQKTDLILKHVHDMLGIPLFKSVASFPTADTPFACDVSTGTISVHASMYHLNPDELKKLFQFGKLVQSLLARFAGLHRLNVIGAAHVRALDILSAGDQGGTISLFTKLCELGWETNHTVAHLRHVNDGIRVRRKILPVQPKDFEFFWERREPEISGKVGAFNRLRAKFRAISQKAGPDTGTRIKTLQRIQQKHEVKTSDLLDRLANARQRRDELEAKLQGINRKMPAAIQNLKESTCRLYRCVAIDESEPLIIDKLKELETPKRILDAIEKGRNMAFGRPPLRNTLGDAALHLKKAEEEFEKAFNRANELTKDHDQTSINIDAAAEQVQELRFDYTPMTLTRDALKNEITPLARPYEEWARIYPKIERLPHSFEINLLSAAGIRSTPCDCFKLLFSCTDLVRRLSAGPENLVRTFSALLPCLTPQGGERLLDAAQRETLSDAIASTLSTVKPEEVLETPRNPISFQGLELICNQVSQALIQDLSAADLVLAELKKENAGVLLLANPSLINPLTLCSEASVAGPAADLALSAAATGNLKLFEVLCPALFHPHIFAMNRQGISQLPGNDKSIIVRQLEAWAANGDDLKDKTVPILHNARALGINSPVLDKWFESLCNSTAASFFAQGSGLNNELPDLLRLYPGDKTLGNAIEKAFKDSFSAVSTNDHADIETWLKKREILLQLNAELTMPLEDLARDQLEQAASNQSLSLSCQVLSLIKADERAAVISAILKRSPETFPVLLGKLNRPFAYEALRSIEESELTEIVRKIKPEKLNELLPVVGREGLTYLSQLQKNLRHALFEMAWQSTDRGWEYIPDPIIRGKETRNLYYLLGVPRNATQEQLDKSLRNMNILFHPDRDPSQTAAETLKDARDAYDILSSQEQRLLFDRSTSRNPSFYPKHAWYAAVPAKMSRAPWEKPGAAGK